MAKVIIATLVLAAVYAAYKYKAAIVAYIKAKLHK
jgi:hypothetical protein